MIECIISAGPTYEPLDEVRRLTNHSTGRLGIELGNFLVQRDCRVTLLLGILATCREETLAQRVWRFSTTQDLAARLKRLAKPQIAGVFHAAAVSDFRFGRVYEKAPDNRLKQRREAKLSSRGGTLLAELRPTAKVIGHLRGWFPRAFLVGWKYEIDAPPSELARKAALQISENATDHCVINGPAYGEGFGVSDTLGKVTHCQDRLRLFDYLYQELRTRVDGKR